MRKGLWYVRRLHTRIVRVGKDGGREGIRGARRVRGQGFGTGEASVRKGGAVVGQKATHACHHVLRVRVDHDAEYVILLGETGCAAASWTQAWGSGVRRVA